MQISTEGPAPAHKAKRRIWIGAVVAIAIAAVAAAVLPKVLRGGDKDKKEPVPLEFVAAEVARPVAARLPLTIEFSGPLVAPRTAVVRAKAAGTLLSLSVAEGSRVKAGQVIGVIDLAEMQSRVADRSALVESAQAALVEAERQNTANVGLAAQNFISPTALQTSQARLDAARAQLKSAQAQLDLAARRRSRCDAFRADLRHRRQAPRRARREGQRRAADRHRRRPVVARAGRIGRHARGVDARSRARSRRYGSRGRAATSPAASTASRPPPRRDARDRRRRRAREQGRALPRRPVRAGARRARRRSRADDGAEQRRRPGVGAGFRLGDRERARWCAASSSPAGATRRPAASRWSRGSAPDAQILAVRFDNLKEGAPAKVVAQRSVANARPERRRRPVVAVGVGIGGAGVAL